MHKVLAGSIVIILLVLIVLVGFDHHTKSKTPVIPLRHYVAMGDSVSAGIGLETYSDSSACDRTNQAYPNLVSSSLHLKLDNLSCSGATLQSGILGRQNVNDLLVAPQLGQLFRQPHPYLITLTIGANDVQWTTYITKCYTGTCGTAEDTSIINGLLNGVSINLKSTLSQIKSHYKKAAPDVIVTGYHQVFPTTSATCSDLIGVNPTEISWVRQQQAKLNSTLSNVVSQYSFVKFAPVNFDGHELCSNNSWVQGLSDNNPYHPTDAGQKAFAKSVITSIKLYK
jgi:lysophospholipase L1-like esterase